MLISQSNFYIPVNYRQLDMLCFLACCKSTNKNQYALHIHTYHYIIIYIYILQIPHLRCVHLLHAIILYHLARFYVRTGLLLILYFSSLCVGTAPVKDSGTNLLSEVHDRVLAASAQERQDVVVTVPHHHPKLDSQEKQKMIEAYGNLEEEEYLYSKLTDLCMNQ